MKEDEVLWTVKEVAEYFRLSIKTVYAKASKEDIPSVRIGRSVRFEPGKIKEIMERRQRNIQDRNCF